MRYEFKYAFGSFIIVPFITILFLAATAGTAGAQDCDITICKSAEDSGDTEFPFTGDSPGGPLDFTLFGDGDCKSFSMPLSQFANVSEEPVEGWVLGDIDCPDPDGVDVAFLENGAVFECVGPNLGSVTCTFVNVLSERPIPTLSEWGMIAAALGLGIVGVFFAVRRRRKAQAV